MDLPVIINAYEDGVPMPAERSLPYQPKLVSRRKMFVHGETLQPENIDLDDSTQTAPSLKPSSELGSRVASIYRSLVQRRSPRKRSASSLSCKSTYPHEVVDVVVETAPITVHSSGSESSSSSASVSIVTHKLVASDTGTAASLTQAPFLCEWCSVTVAPADAEEHLRSTVHRFNMQYRPSRGHYYLNENNVGYRMLKDMKWTEEEGLGALSQGRLEPIATRLKNDKVGLGAASQQPLRVTHKEEEMAKEREVVKRRKEEKRRGRAGKGRREQRALAESERKQEDRIREEVYADDYLL